MVSNYLIQKLKKYIKENLIIRKKKGNMTKQELGQVLYDMYENAKSGEKVTMIHLFGIKYRAY